MDKRRVKGDKGRRKKNGRKRDNERVKSTNSSKIRFNWSSSFVAV